MLCAALSFRECRMACVEGSTCNFRIQSNMTLSAGHYFLVFCVLRAVIVRCALQEWSCHKALNASQDGTVSLA